MAFLQLVEGDVLAEFAIEVQLDPRAFGEEAVHVLLDHMGRAAEARDAPDHHAAGPVRHLVEMNRVARDREVMRGGEAGGAGADDADGLFVRDRTGFGV